VAGASSRSFLKQDAPATVRAAPKLKFDNALAKHNVFFAEREWLGLDIAEIHLTGSAEKPGKNTVGIRVVSSRPVFDGEMFYLPTQRRLFALRLP
jgi:hypothetical protein